MVVLREFRLDDLDAVRAASDDPYIPLITTVPWIYDDAAGRAFVERQRSRAAEGVGWSFAIAGATGDRMLGQIGLWPRDPGRASIGYFVIPRARGRGLGARALRLIADWAVGDLGFERLELSVEPWNLASLRTAQRAGFTREAVLRSRYEFGGARRDVVSLSRLATDPPPSDG